MTGESINGKERINTFLETNENQTLETKKTNIPLEENTKEISANTHIKSYDDTNKDINNDNAPTIISKQSIHKSDKTNYDDKVGSIEDKIIKSYLSKQANSFGINISGKNESFNVVDTSSSDADSTPLLDIFKKEELLKKRKSSKLSLRKKEEIKHSKQICDSEISENNKAGNKDKNNKFRIDLNSSKNKECDNNNFIKEQSENIISSDDELLINIIKDEHHKNDKYSKNKFNRNKKEDDISSCGTSDYDSDAVLIVKSKKKGNDKFVHNNNVGNKKNIVSTKNAKLVALKFNNIAKNVAKNKTKNKTKNVAKNKTKNKTKNVAKNKTKNKKTTIKNIGKLGKNANNTVKKQTNKNIEKKKKKIQKKTKNYENDDIETDSIIIGSFDPRNRSPKEKLVAQLLTRWWYVLPDWPIPYYDYTTELENKKLKLVSLEEFEDHEDIDKHGFKKVYEISAFPGVFRDSLGTAYDLRDKETCPCYNNFIKKTDLELLQLICAAIKNQIICLKNSVYNETYKEVILEKELKEAESKLRKVMDKNNKIAE
ncbi:conserved Plasmodium protein, unknown function [Plasmodium berghei]|uniref:Uncharacterized protein n=2 Tax=Plasmodium berghei TaxID=5821 RepID=A0A509AHV8_PLABA|nr:conserved protein, unknown function [Plasmodium berghei ANKA]CXI22845.1 conserved Plasmodium protein, unknown function [Plasmodium berghei]SCM20135.1 conserved Plasmodium protein, unknown function [Plasmodium berghei]SCN23776.1 conserved Plasmodium protein, unknown function [Plasmodium berghei]SCO59231.1 conserved Plasmodium protein, unknown function [Plasmodium berghei]SCO60143.1 conserved Plasmodium protein, unknown function [Plasmodium berghei]|eukprot:XP_034420770.1 conserved protein, unknown function [Plasmodium berghei ANKA]